MKAAIRKADGAPDGRPWAVVLPGVGVLWFPSYAQARRFWVMVADTLGGAS